MMLRGLGDCAYVDGDGNCIDDGSSIDTSTGGTGSGGSSSIPVIVAPSTTLTAAQTAAQISNAANQLLLTSQGRGVYTGPGGVQYIQPQGNAANVFAATSTTGNLSASGTIGGISTGTLMLMAIGAVALIVLSKAGK